ncbi:hypothetical protein [Rhizobium sp. CF080]|uniref:hypothetical protein n=1 Tax=Rhizobium sp. (strain CF080) TaxID=1144310 RepID=UPI00055FB457|nr:hypothetical protein [Rhizobium sp. CF080]
MFTLASVEFLAEDGAAIRRIQFEIDGERPQLLRVDIRHPPFEALDASILKAHDEISKRCEYILHHAKDSAEQYKKNRFWPDQK